jgi:ABC-type nitrate/sulfonate/bicarbonate transport system ATPase subunit
MTNTQRAIADAARTHQPAVDVSAGSDDDPAVASTDAETVTETDTRDMLIELADVSYTYPNGLQAVSDVSLRIDRGSRLGVVGPSGCGKSTLLRLITELAQPERGRIVRNYEAMSDRAPIAMVFQEDTLLPWLTVRKNVSLYYRMHPGILSKAEIDERVDHLLSMVGLDGFGDMFPRQLSGGMKRRVAFLAAIAPRPQLLLLDEPFSSVDEPTRVEIHQQVRDILDEFKITTILVTHDLAEALSLMDTVAILSARPARVAQLRSVELDGGSDLLEARATPQFLELYGHLWEALSHEIRVARGVGTSAADGGGQGTSR